MSDLKELWGSASDRAENACLVGLRDDGGAGEQVRSAGVAVFGQRPGRDLGDIPFVDQ